MWKIYTLCLGGGRVRWDGGCGETGDRFSKQEGHDYLRIRVVSATPPGGTHTKKKPKAGIPTDICELVYSIQIVHSSWKMATARMSVCGRVDKPNVWSGILLSLKKEILVHATTW